MEISYRDSFKKAFKKRFSHNKKQINKINQRISQFKINTSNPLLKTHALVGTKKGLYSFSASGDIRIVFFYENNESAIFIDIGSHNQVY